VGGLLSAFALSKERVFLQKAEELVGHLLPAFDTVTGIPTGRVNLGKREAVRPIIYDMYFSRRTKECYYVDLCQSV